MKLIVHSPRVSYYYGGAENFILQSTLAMQSLEDNIILVTYDAPKKSDWFREFSKKFKGKIILIKSKEMDNHFYLFKDSTIPKIWDKESILFSKATKELYKYLKSDVITYHYAVDCLNAPKDRKVILHLHGLPDTKRKIEAKAIKFPDRLIALSNYIAKGWKKLHKIKKKISVSYNGVDIKYLSSKPNKNIDLLYFGRLIKIKGVNILIQSINCLIKQSPKLKIAIVGDGPEKEGLIKLCKKLKLTNNIKFIGFISDIKLKRIILNSKVCIFPSYSREGILTTLLEACSLNSCVITSNSCSFSEFIKDKTNGLLFISKDYRDLAKKIRLTLNNKPFRDYLSNNAYISIKKFSWKLQAKKLYLLYKK